jgi:hypothetical protein
MSNDPNPKPRKRSRVIRTAHALPNAAEHDKANSRLAGATARYASPAASDRQAPSAQAPVTGEDRSRIQPEPKPVTQPSSEAQKTAVVEKSPKKNVRGFVVWLPSDIIRLKALSDRLGTTLSYLEKALMKTARTRYLALDLAAARSESPQLRPNLDLTRADGAGGLFVNAYSDPDILRALRSDINDPLDLIANARIIGALFRLYGLEALEGYETTTGQ